MTHNYLRSYELNFSEIWKHYHDRHQISLELQHLLSNQKKVEYVELAVGVSKPLGNYSADEHNLGWKILDNNQVSSIFELADSFLAPELKIRVIPDLIYEANLKYLKIGVGSEMACLLAPEKYWVGNVRTIWTHLLSKYDGDSLKANSELEYYKLDESSSEMYYPLWKDIYPKMGNDLRKVMALAHDIAREQGAKVDNNYLWVDAVCSHLYENR
jgi:hypothetical protein